MAIEKLTEFAKTGQKDTDNLDLEVGFIVNRKPARQWFNWLFNTLTTKINEIIDADFMPKSDVIDNLTTSDANKPVSAKQAKLLQDNKLDVNKRSAMNGVASLDENTKVPVAELPSATSSVAGVMRLINDLTTGGTNAALTAEQGKLFFEMFRGGDKHFRIPNPATGKPLIIQTDIFAAASRTGSVNFPIAFPNRFLAAFIMHSTANETQLFYAGTTVPRSLSNLGYVFSANPNGGSFQYIAIGD